jgi:hypothetical protein
VGSAAGDSWWWQARKEMARAVVAWGLVGGGDVFTGCGRLQPVAAAERAVATVAVRQH